LERNGDVDITDAEYLFRSQKLDAHILRERYEKEFRPYIIGDMPMILWNPQPMTDTTLNLWIEIFTS
jgi:hypothetical protein